MSISIVAISGSLHAPSKTRALVEQIDEEFRRQLGDEAEITLIDLAEHGRDFAGALSAEELSPAAHETIRRIEQADVLVAASPVYRASFTGLFKHVFDFIDQYALVDTPVVLAATGGSQRHALIIDHQFRPLFAFFHAIPAPVGLYASTEDFTDGQLSNEALRERITRAVSSTLLIARGQLGQAASSYVSSW